MQISPNDRAYNLNPSYQINILEKTDIKNYRFVTMSY
jgi:hypothetical protein